MFHHSNSDPETTCKCPFHMSNSQTLQLWCKKEATIFTLLQNGIVKPFPPHSTPEPGYVLLVIPFVIFQTQASLHMQCYLKRAGNSGLSSPVPSFTNHSFLNLCPKIIPTSLRAPMVPFLQGGFSRASSKLRSFRCPLPYGWVMDPKRQPLGPTCSSPSPCQVHSTSSVTRDE